MIDLKWTNRSKYRREEITKGDAMQLALYHWALDDGPDPMSTVAEDAPMSYYMLKQGEFASTSKLFGPGPGQPRVQPEHLAALRPRRRILHLGSGRRTSLGGRTAGAGILR